MDELIIEAGRTEAHYWRDLWRYRDLFYFLAWRDLLVRYKQTVFGVLWAIGDLVSDTFTHSAREIECQRDCRHNDDAHTAVRHFTGDRLQRGQKRTKALSRSGR